MNLPNPYKHRAIVKIKFNNDYYGAVEDLDKAIRLDSNYSIAFKERGIAKKHLKMPYCEDFNSACILGDKELVTFLMLIYVTNLSLLS